MEKVLLPSPGEGLSESYIPKIMIVDDDEEHLQLIKLIMLREGLTCELFLCHRARQALEFLAGTAVDLVLLDVMMPDLDGFQVLDQLKDNPDTANIPVIILTSTQETDYVVRAFAHGAVDYISK
ncbi:MAG: response regulator, partial [bacterium]